MIRSRITNTAALVLTTIVFLLTPFVPAAAEGSTNNDQNALRRLTPTTALANNPPVIAAGSTSVSPGSVDRFGAGTTSVSVTFSDGDHPLANSFFVTFEIRGPFNEVVYVIADSLQDGQGGMSIVDIGGNQYTASIAWNPPDNAQLGYYDLTATVTDGIDQAVDTYADNPNELLISNGGENSPPVVPSDAVFASPAGVVRIGANSTALSATYSDGDAPPLTDFRVTFKLRLPDNSTEIVLADNVADGTGGISITDQGGGIYTASISWDPPDAQTLGVYDLYFHVTDGIDTSYDGFSNNLDELEIYDAVSNNPPTLVAGTTMVVPNSITRVGSEYTMIKSVFSDVDAPGIGAFTVTIKVRDQAAGETIVVNAAHNSQQGLRIRHLSGPDYEAAVLWDPPGTQAADSYDLYFYVEDDSATSATDAYINNLSELTVTSAAILGDGNILRRTNDAGTCGGPNAACHNLPDHQAQDCRVCHTPHQTANIYLVRDTIQTPNSGKRQVVFKTLGIGDPYNDPDPVVGDPTSGVMADSTNGVFTGVCEVCHTTTAHHRNDGSEPPPNHHDAEDCTVCHPHDQAFAAGESGGGSACSCHSTIFATMDSTAVFSRHILANDAANYSPGVSGMYTIKNCLTCHVDHDVFRSDLNPGIGQRSKNLRVDWAIDPVSGTDTVLANSDYSSTGNGGICLSCHSGPGCDGCHSAHLASSLPVVAAERAKPSTFAHVFIPKSDFDAATTAHNYAVPSTYSSDGSTFNANCSKCHSDDLAKAYQNPAPRFSTHGSTFEDILDSSGIAAATNPLEEEFCFKCHSTTSNPNAGSSLDFFGVKSITNPDALDLEAVFSRTYTHPTLTYSGRHSLADSAQSLADGNRHAECTDCHNPHAAQQGTHDGTSNLVSNALKGTWGVEPGSWPAAPTPTDNGNVFAVPATYSKVDPAQKEYQICLKCHSNYTTLPTGARNLAEEINPNYPSTHGIVQAGTNPYCNTTTMNLPWGSSKIAWCSDCHRSSNTADPEGPHGSNLEHLLVATVVSDNSNGTPLCYVCHKSSVYWSGDASASRMPQHPSSKGAHKRSQGCFACHMWDYSGTAGLGVPTTNWSGGTPPAGIFVHGQNKKWVYNETDGSAGSGQADDAFVNGYIANIDYTNRRCWAQTCKNHSDKGY